MASDYFEDDSERVEAAPAAPPPLAQPVPKRKRRGCGFWLVIALIVMVLGFVLLGILGVLGERVLSSAIPGKTVVTGSGTTLVEQTLEGDGDEKILLIPIRGIISDLPEKGFIQLRPSMVASVHEMLKAARRDEQIKALILVIDSPGGGVTASDVLHHELSAFHDATGLPIVAMLGDVAASGGYYVASASQYIVAHPTSVTGSVGVIIPLLGIESLLGKIGVESRPIKSGALKDLGSAYRSMSETERKMLQGIVDEIHERFLEVVVQGFEARGVRRSRAHIEQHCDGRVFTGEQAKALGFVDEVGYFENALRAAREKAGLSPDETRLIRYQPKTGLLGLLRAHAATPRPDTLTLRIEGLTTGESPRLLYLWTVGRSGLQSSFKN